MSKAFDEHFISACNQCYERGRADRENELVEIFGDMLHEIFDFVWDRDIPSPTCPEYVEHHRDCTEIMEFIKKKSNEFVSEQLKSQS